jgi:hypothetical protein
MNTAEYKKLRTKYLPKQIACLFVLESPPISGKYFYQENGNISEPLFSEMMKLCKYKAQNKMEGLKYYSEIRNYYLIDATYEPVNNLTGKKRNNKILLNYINLRDEISELGNPKTILVKANICRLLEQPLINEGMNIVNNGIIVPFPSTGNQKNFHQKIQEIFKRTGIEA